MYKEMDLFVSKDGIMTLLIARPFDHDVDMREIRDNNIQDLIDAHSRGETIYPVITASFMDDDGCGFRCSFMSHRMLVDNYNPVPSNNVLYNAAVGFFKITRQTVMSVCYAKLEDDIDDMLDANLCDKSLLN